MWRFCVDEAQEKKIDRLSIGIAGAGRMGEAVLRALRDQDDLRLAGIWARDPDTAAGRLGLVPGETVSSDLAAIAAVSDVLVDFSLPAATPAVVEAALGSGRPLVCGVSGLEDDAMTLLDEAARHIPVVFDRNMSQGIAVLERLVREAGAALGDTFEVSIHETHHVHKRDAPSGTALKLGEALARVRGVPPDTLHYESERRGEVPGDHTVIFRSPTECLELRHSVTTRAVFADGALRAARWVSARAPGRYAMKDVLG